MWGRIDKVERSIGTDRSKRLMADRRGSMPFSVAAVLILLMASFSFLLSEGTDINLNGSSKSDLKLMSSLADQAWEDASETCYQVALSCAQRGGVDPLAAVALYPSQLESALNQSFPRLNGQYLTRLDNSTVNLVILSLSVSSPLLGASDAHNGTYQPAVPGFFGVQGSLIINVSHGSDFLRREGKMDRDLFHPLPFLADRLSTYQGNMEGSGSRMWHMVRSELDGLLQARLFSKGFIVEHDLSQYLTVEDVNNAIVLATILLQGETFHTYDRSLLSSFLQPPQADSIDTTTILPWLQVDHITLDPVDLFLRLNDKTSFSLSYLLSQSLYGTVDALVLQWLDYLQIADLCTAVENLFQAGIFAVKDLLGDILGKDLSGDTLKDWLDEIMDQKGLSEASYRYIGSEIVDSRIQVAPHVVWLRNLSGGLVPLTLGGDYGLDFPQVDIYESRGWGRFYERYRLSSADLVDSIRSYLYRLGAEIANKAFLSEITLTLDPSDEMSFLEEMGSVLSTTLEESDGWLQGPLNSANDEGIPDPLGPALIDYLRTLPEDIFEGTDARQHALQRLGSSMLDQVILQDPSFGGPRSSENLVTIEMALAEVTWGVGISINESYSFLVNQTIQNIEQGLKGRSTQGNWLEDGVRTLMSGAISSVPGMEAVCELTLRTWMADVMNSCQLRGECIEPVQWVNEPFQFITGQGTGFTVALSVQTMWSLSQQIDQKQAVRIRCPLSANVQGNNPNVHLIDLSDPTTAPFQNTWDISVDAGYAVVLQADSPALGSTISVRRQVDLWCGQRLCALSSIPLPGVDYRPSSTLTSDLLNLVDRLWELTKSGLGVIGDALSALYDLLTQLMSKIYSMSANALAWISDLLWGVVDESAALFSDLLIEPLAHLIELLWPDDDPADCQMHWFGMTFRLIVNGGSSDLVGGWELLRLELVQKWGSSSLGIALRIVRSSDQHYYSFINATFIGPNMRTNAILDPLMRLFPHMFELRGRLGGIMMDIVLPEVLIHNEMSWSLSDLPGMGTLLSNIPLPLAGLKARIDAGIKVEMALINTDHPVINEFELNPKGKDGDGEWVEIFNPTDKAYSLSGWTIMTTHGKVRADELGDVILLPGGRLLYQFTEQALDNCRSTGFPDMERLLLYDSQGERVDSTPFVFDDRNDGRTWQRSYDGSDSWEFRSGTPGAQNSRLRPTSEPDQDLLDIVTRTLGESVQLFESLGYSLESISEVISTTVRNLGASLAEHAAEWVVEAGLFLEVAICDLSGSISTVFRTEISVEGAILQDAFDWFSDCVHELFQDFAQPLSSSLMDTGIGVLVNHTWWTFSIGMEAGLPSMLTIGMDEKVLEGAFEIRGNLAWFFSPSTSCKRLEMGAVLSGVAPSDLSDRFAPLKDAVVDVWLVRLSLLSE